jgi:hypothetical protein
MPMMDLITIDNIYKVSNKYRSMTINWMKSSLCSSFIIPSLPLTIDIIGINQLTLLMSYPSNNLRVILIDESRKVYFEGAKPIIQQLISMINNNNMTLQHIQFHLPYDWTMYHATNAADDGKELLDQLYEVTGKCSQLRLFDYNHYISDKGHVAWLAKVAKSKQLPLLQQLSLDQRSTQFGAILEQSG